MKRPSVYLAGPITGQSYEGATNWRDEVTTAFKSHGIDCFSPLRTKSYLFEETSIGDCYDDYVLSSQRGIFARDMFDCRSKDAIFINLLDAGLQDDGSPRVSIGTVMEIAWGVAFNKPMVLVMDKDNIHDHAMIREACPFIVNTIEEGINIMRSILLSENY